MGERKVLNKYIPADFDPRLVPRSKKPKDNLVPVRMMLPFSIQCSTCSSFMYRGRKFNSQKEPVSGPNGKYLSIQRYRFYIKCTVCSRPITFLTDPKNADYEMESGATRNYEIWHDKEKTEEEIAEEVDLEESVDPLKALENRVLDSQREMADLDNLDEIKAMNMRHVQMMRSGSGLGSVAAVLKHSKGDVAELALNEDGLTQEEVDMVQSIQFAKQQNQNKTSLIKRLGQEDEEMLELKRKREEEILQQQFLKQKTKVEDKPLIPVINVKRKRIEPPKQQTEKNDDSKNKSSSKIIEKINDGSDDNGGLSGLLGAYDSSSAEDDE